MMYSEVRSYDVVVIGAGPGGLPAAIAAARLGASVLLVDRNGFLGGNLASGLPLLSFLDRNGRQVIGGIAQEFIDRLVELRGSFGHARCPLHNSVTVIQPELMKIVAIEKALEAGVQILLHSELSEVIIKDKRITSVVLAGKGAKTIVTAKVFIDGTGDGDLAFACGANYEKGNEITGDIMPASVVFTLGGVNQSAFFDYLDDNPDQMILPSSQEVDPGYNSAFFRSTPSHSVVGLKLFLDTLREQGECPIERDTLIVNSSPNNNQVVINSIRLFHIDGSNLFDLARGELNGQRQVLQLTDVLKKHLPGFENCYISSIAPFIGIRESRRFLGIKRLTIHSVRSGIIPSDTVSLSAYKIDIHSNVTSETKLETIDTPYGIPYGCMVSSDIDGLMFTGRCISVDALTFGSVRVMPTCMAIGHAAGVGAALAAQNDLSPKCIDVQGVRELLLSQKAII